VFVRQLCVTQIVLRFFKVDLRDDATGMRLISTPFLAFRGDEGYICQVRRLALFECQLPRLDPLPFKFHFALFQRGLCLLQLVCQLRADNGRKDLAFYYPFAGFSEKSDCAARSRIQRRADGSNDATLNGNILNKVATCNGGYSDPVHRNAYARVGPPLYNGRHEPGTSNHRESNPADNQVFAPWVSRRNANILRRCVLNFQLSTPRSDWLLANLDVRGEENV
jgi:hypothetical protein